MSPRTFLKRALIFACNRGWISGTAVTRAFSRFDLWGA